MGDGEVEVGEALVAEDVLGGLVALEVLEEWDLMVLTVIQPGMVQVGAVAAVAEDGGVEEEVVEAEKVLVVPEVQEALEVLEALLEGLVELVLPVLMVIVPGMVLEAAMEMVEGQGGEVIGGEEGRERGGRGG